jgi:hypothetical protein
VSDDLTASFLPSIGWPSCSRLPSSCAASCPARFAVARPGTVVFWRRAIRRAGGSSRAVIAVGLLFLVGTSPGFAGVPSVFAILVFAASKLFSICSVFLSPRTRLALGKKSFSSWLACFLTFSMRSARRRDQRASLQSIFERASISPSSFSASPRCSLAKPASSACPAKTGKTAASSPFSCERSSVRIFGKSSERSAGSELAFRRSSRPVTSPCSRARCANTPFRPTTLPLTAFIAPMTSEAIVSIPFSILLVMETSACTSAKARPRQDEDALGELSGSAGSPCGPRSRRLWAVFVLPEVAKDARSESCYAHGP